MLGLCFLDIMANWHINWRERGRVESLVELMEKQGGKMGNCMYNIIIIIIIDAESKPQNTHSHQPFINIFNLM